MSGSVRTAVRPWSRRTTVRRQPSPSVPDAAQDVAAAWELLVRDRPTPPGFSTAMLEDLPEPARRWLTRAIAPGTPLWSSAELMMHGRIKVRRWAAFHATQVLSPPDGYVWAASARFWGLPVRGFDRLSSGTAEMRWRVLGRVPVVTASGADVVRSAAGRVAIEGVLVPTAFRRATWTQGPDPDTVLATWPSAGGPQQVELRVGPTGALVSAVLHRWGHRPGPRSAATRSASASTRSAPSAGSRCPRSSGRPGGGAPRANPRVSSSVRESPASSSVDRVEGLCPSAAGRRGASGL